MKYLVLCPSNQDRNRYAGHPDLSEREVLHAIAHRVPSAEGITVVVIDGAPESEDRTRLEGLISQLDRARTYLEETKVSPRDAVILSLHSDSGAASHVFGCFGGNIGSEGYKLGMGVAACVANVFDVQAKPYALPGYLFDTRRGPYTAALLECGSHQNEHDINILLSKQNDVALTILAGALGYWQIAVGPYYPPNDDETYFSLHGKPYNPSFAIPKFWRALRANGVNLGPALTDEMDGSRFGEPGHTFQFFEAAAIVCHPEEAYSCFLWQTFLHLSPWTG